MLRWALLPLLLGQSFDSAPLRLAQDRDLQPVEEFGLRVAPGFKVTLYADHTLANDIYSMTLDTQGRVVVTSQGWIRTLHDTDGDGKADKATTYAQVGSGGMGMCFDGNEFLFAGDGALWRYRDTDGDGKPDGERERIAKFTGGEHGHHAMRKGPDGYWYLIGGNDAMITKDHVTLPKPVIAEPETGGIVRFTPDLSQSEVIAHGFRNPYDFDFNEAGDIFTYDSDCERDYYLPWYTPTRIYHVAYGMHHGWRLRGYLRSFCRRDYWPDTVDILWPIGRGSPTGVTVYRHTAFPERYRGGVFALDWTFGRVWFLPLKPEGAGYTTKAEVFLEPRGSEGFAPTDVCVAPDGSMFVSIGGRRTRGAVYRITPVDAKKPAEPKNDLEAVLRAPQPLDAWSRAKWEPLARKLGEEAFQELLRSKDASPAERVRAIEILTELFMGLREGLAAEMVKRPEAEVRARAAWSMISRPAQNLPELFERLAADEDPRVRRETLHAWANYPKTVAIGSVQENLGHPDRRVRQAAQRVAEALPEPVWGNLLKGIDKKHTQARLTASFAGLRRGLPAEAAIAAAIPVLWDTKEVDLRLQAVRLIVAALGDCNLAKPPVEVQANYSVPTSLPPDRRMRVLQALCPNFPTDNVALNLEASRLLAMLEDEDGNMPPMVAGLITEKSDATSDLHYLIVLSRLKGRWPEGMAAKIVDALLSLGRKLEGGGQRTKQTWNERTAELTRLFLAREPGFADEILKHPALVIPGHIGIAGCLQGPQRIEAARRFLAAAGKDRAFAWSEALLNLLSQLPADEFHPALRAQWSNFGLRDSILLHLAKAPDPQDREKYLVGVESAHPQAARVSLESLEKLPRDESRKNLVPLLRLLRRLSLEPKQAAQRKQVLALVSRQIGRSYEATEGETTPSALKQVYQPVFNAFPDLKAELEGSGVDVAALLKSVAWDGGDVARGAEVFRARGCQTCHAVQGALGPNLAGAATRFSRDDLFEAIANPNRDVAPLYRTTVFQTKDGQVHTGIIAFESADGYIVQTGATTTVRVNTPDIAGLRPGTLSIMPNGLLDGLKPEEIADLYAYLKSLK